MAAVVVDTTVLIDHLRGRTEAQAALAAIIEAGDELCGVTISRTEVLAGMRRGEEAATYRLLGSVRWIDVTTDLADAAGRLAQRYLRSHRGVETADLLIAAATEAIDGRLLTLNVRHFPMFEGLQPAYE